jgi:hypothetical protein
MTGWVVPDDATRGARLWMMGEMQFDFGTISARGHF